MNGIHDMGGMQDMGPIRRERDEPVSRADWEKRVYALASAVDVDLPVFRYQIELIPPADYLRMSTFERWLVALTAVVTNAGMVTRAEIETGKPTIEGAQKWHVVSAAEVPTWIVPESNAKPRVGAPPRFHVGQHVRARNINPAVHTRLPRYTRGKAGVVMRDNGVDALSDSVAQGLGEKPQHVYSVRFTARELWGEQANAIDSVYVDLWDDYLEPA
jgi:nitrile hydratase subunit beta